MAIFPESAGEDGVGAESREQDSCKGMGDRCQKRAAAVLKSAILWGAGTVRGRRSQGHARRAGVNALRAVKVWHRLRELIRCEPFDHAHGSLTARAEPQDGCGRGRYRKRWRLDR